MSNKRNKRRILAAIIAVVFVSAAFFVIRGISPHHIKVPEDFPEITVSGRSEGKCEYYVPFNGSFGHYIAKLNEKGEVIKIRKTGPFTDEKSETIYNYMPVESSEVDGCYFEKCGLPSSQDAYTELVMLDEKMEEIKRTRYILDNSAYDLANSDKNDAEKAMLKKEKTLAVDPHDGIVFGKDDYIICSSRVEKVNNIPKDTGHDSDRAMVVYVQEIKNGKMKWQFKSSDYPEFYRYKMDKMTRVDHFKDDFSDYMHFNSMCIDPKDGNLLLSFRNQCSIVKLNRTTGRLMWILGGKGNEFKIPDKGRFMCQHSISVTEEGHLLMYDNQLEGRESRILELEYDEKRKRVTVFKTIPLGVSTVNWGLVRKINKGKYIVNVGNVTDLEVPHGFFIIDAKTGERTFEVSYPDNKISFWAYRKEKK